MQPFLCSYQVRHFDWLIVHFSKKLASSCSTLILFNQQVQACSRSGGKRTLFLGSYRSVKVCGKLGSVAAVADDSATVAVVDDSATLAVVYELTTVAVVDDLATVAVVEDLATVEILEMLDDFGCSEKIFATILLMQTLQVPSASHFYENILLLNWNTYFRFTGTCANPETSASWTWRIFTSISKGYRCQLARRLGWEKLLQRKWTVLSKESWENTTVMSRWMVAKLGRESTCISHPRIERR